MEAITGWRMITELKSDDKNGKGDGKSRVTKRLRVKAQCDQLSGDLV